MKDRSSKILDIIAAKGRVNVAKLSEALGVSQVTIRKDLDKLEQTGIINREHGYAQISQTNEILARLVFHYEEKLKIATRAAQLVNDNQTIMIESGSCCALLARQLAHTKNNLTIITNSAFIADYIRKDTNSEIVLLGGIYQHDSQAMVGPMIAKCVKNFYIDKFFIGIDGYSAKTGFTNHDQMRARAVTHMSEQCKSIIVLSESSKFSQTGTVPMHITNKVSTVITDSNISKNAMNELAQNNIKTMVVE